MTPNSTTRPVLLVKSGGTDAMEEWRAAFSEFAPDIDVRQWNDPDVPVQAVEYVLVWQPDAGRIAQFPNLKTIISSAAGVDHILADPDLPAATPIARMVTQETVQRMTEFTLMASLMLLKEGEDYWTTLRALVTAAKIAGPKIHDARVAALCLQHGVAELWTADRDFSRFPKIGRAHV